MIDGSTDDGEPQGDVHAVIEMEQFQGDQSLVVVHADNGVEVAFGGKMEQGVRGNRTDGIDAGAYGIFHSRTDDPDFLVAEKAGFAAVRIQGEDGEARTGA